MNFYVITFIDHAGRQQIGRTFSTLRMARKFAVSVASYGTDIRIMRGGPGGIQVGA